MDKPVVMITGASSGIGKSTALTLGRNGFRVVLAARRIEKLEEIADRIRKDGGEAYPVFLDLSDVENIKRVVSLVKADIGEIEILVNNAGSARHLWLDELDLEKDIHHQIQINLIGMIQLTRAVLVDMLAAGSGQIIHVASITSWVGVPTYSIYSASKFGARGFYESLRRELRGKGITISEVFPGAVDTEFAHDPEIAWRTTTVAPEFALLSSQDVAEKILQMIKTKQKRSVIPEIMRLVIWGNTLFPRLVGWVFSWFFYTKKDKRYSWGQTRE